MIRCVTFLLLLCVVSGAGSQTLIDYVIAVVNGDAVTRSELDSELSIAAIMRTSVTNTLTVAERRAMLDTIIDRKLILQESKRLGIVVTERDARVEEKIAEIRKKYASDAAFQRALQRHGLEDKALKAWVYEQLVYDEFFRRIFFNALNSAEIATLTKSYYDANAAEFIMPPTVTFNALFIFVPKDASETEKQKAEGLVQQLYARLEQGETFDAVRETYRTQLAIRFEVLTLEVDTPLGTVVAEFQNSERSAPLPVSDGYQIVECIQSNPARQKTYAEVSEEIIDRIQQEKAETEFAAWLAERREEESWHILDDALGGRSETK
jgi:parvulin-like peptidyl-prolyl isomerase